MIFRQLATVQIDLVFPCGVDFLLHTFEAENEQKAMKGIHFLFLLIHVPVKKIRLLFYETNIL